MRIIVVKVTGPPRKRIRKSEKHKSYIAKQNVERGMAHEGKKNQFQQNYSRLNWFANAMKKKQKLGCAKKINVQRQQELFEAYYKEMNWSQKTLFIRGNVKRQPVKTKKSSQYPIKALKNRNFIHRYSLIDHEGIEQIVCRDFFLTCLDVTSNRVQNALKSFCENPSAKDKRGNGPSGNKTKENELNDVRSFINSIPKYESHYGRSKSQRKYLLHNLNMKKLYDEYKSTRRGNEKAVSEYVFRQTFNTEFNLSFKRRHTDTCKTCDEFESAIQSKVVPEPQKNHFREMKQNHLDIVEKTRHNFAEDIEEAKYSEGETVVLTFDLEKTLETPLLSTSVAFYKRQLWTYNLCIFDEVTKLAYMYIWNESIASRGGQEIGSCLLKHLKNNIPLTVKRIILYSDRCGGQNKNIKLTMLLQKFLYDLSPDVLIATIEQKYFVSGHSYNSCDRNFALIEKKRKKSSDIFTPSDWVELTL